MNVDDESDEVDINDDDNKKYCFCCKKIIGLRIWNIWSIFFNVIVTAALIVVAVLLEPSLWIVALIHFFIRLFVSIYGFHLVRKRKFNENTSYQLYGLLSLIFAYVFDIILMIFIYNVLVPLLYYTADNIDDDNDNILMICLLILYPPFILDMIIVTCSFIIFAIKFRPKSGEEQNVAARGYDNEMEAVPINSAPDMDNGGIASEMNRYIK